MGLAVLVFGNVKEFEGTDTSANHDQESDKLNIFYLLLVSVL